MASRVHLLSVVMSGCVLLAACGDDGPAADATTDTAVPDVATDTMPPDPGPLYPAELPAASELEADHRGRRLARAIIHMHSPLSHDACDGQDSLAEATGEASAACWDHLRDAICAVRPDVVMLTDHAPYVHEMPFEELLNVMPGDELVTDAAGATVASRLTCPDGHRALITIGSENGLMPVGLRRHVTDDTGDALESAYDAESREAADLFREAGALVIQNHPEEDSVEHLASLGLDALEVYNLHANLDPQTRENLLGLDGTAFVAATFEFLDRRNSFAPDMLWLAFFETSEAYSSRWGALIDQGQRVVGVAGTDAHENSFPNLLSDGERIDGYRRMMRWFSNHMLIEGEITPDSVHEALERGRLWIAYEAYGSPVGMDFHGVVGDESFDMGDDAPVGVTLHVSRPSLPADHPQDPAPTISMRIIRADPSGTVEVASGSDETLEFVVTEAGSYRAEVRIVPEHTRPFLDGRGDTLINERPWVQTNHIHVVEASPPPPEP